MPNTTPLDEEDRLGEILAKTPCVQCDGSGGIQISEDEAEQCQFCWQLRYPFIETAKQELTKLIQTLEKKARVDGVMKAPEIMRRWETGLFLKTSYGEFIQDQFDNSRLPIDLLNWNESQTPNNTTTRSGE